MVMGRSYPVADLVAHDAADYSLDIEGHRFGFTEHTWGPPSPSSETFTIGHFGPVAFTARMPALAAWGLTILLPLLLVCGLLIGRTLMRRRDRAPS